MNLPSADGREKRLRELDGWRALSVALVILHHLTMYQHPEIVQALPSLARMLNYCGPLGVKIFFTISGFVICRLLIAEEQEYGNVSLKGFYYRRIFRILPPFYLYLGTVCLLMFLDVIETQGRAILNAALFLCDVHVQPENWFTGHTWSLAVEEQFYLLFPAIFVMTPKRRRGLVFACVFLFCVAWNLSVLHEGRDVSVSSNTRVGFGCIIAGVILAFHEKRARALARAVPAIIVPLLAIMLLAHPVSSAGLWWVSYESVIVPSAISLMLMFSLERAPLLRAVLCSKPLQAVGLTSYGVYLWQQLLTAPDENLSSSIPMTPLPLLLFLVVPLSYFLIEKPCMRYGKELSRRVRQCALPAVVAERTYHRRSCADGLSECSWS